MKLHATALAALLILAACGGEKAEPPAAAAPQAALPAGLFGAAPADAKALSEVRAAAKKGDAIAFTGYIGGREKPFTDGRAIFLVADSVKAPACGDECKTPWDACCTPGEEIAANSATVQVADASGAAMKLSLDGQGGLAPGAKVAVSGKVREAGSGVLIVDAERIAKLP